MDKNTSIEGKQVNITHFFCQPPNLSKSASYDPNTEDTSHDSVLSFWNLQGPVLTVCKFQGNPLKLSIFDPKNKVDV